MGRSNLIASITNIRGLEVSELEEENMLVV